jgi:hypothetical protein
MRGWLCLPWWKHSCHTCWFLRSLCYCLLLSSLPSAYLLIPSSAPCPCIHSALLLRFSFLFTLHVIPTYVLTLKCACRVLAACSCTSGWFSASTTSTTCSATTASCAACTAGYTCAGGIAQLVGFSSLLLILFCIAFSHRAPLPPVLLGHPCFIPKAELALRFL